MRVAIQCANRPSRDGGCGAGDSFRPTRFVVVHTRQCYVSTISHLVVHTDITDVTTPVGFLHIMGNILIIIDLIILDKNIRFQYVINRLFLQYFI